jgi:hypothetical protein
MNTPLTRIATAVALACAAAGAQAQSSPAREAQIPGQSPLEPSITGLSFVRPDFTVTA